MSGLVSDFVSIVLNIKVRFYVLVSVERSNNEKNILKFNLKQNGNFTQHHDSAQMMKSLFLNSNNFRSFSDKLFLRLTFKKQSSSKFKPFTCLNLILLKRVDHKWRHQFLLHAIHCFGFVLLEVDTKSFTPTFLSVKIFSQVTVFMHHKCLKASHWTAS
jgi:hypothetical protein